MRWDGLKNYASEKLITGVFVAGAVSGRNFVAVKTVIAATLPYLDYVLPSHTTTPSVNQSAVIQWMIEMRTEVLKLWGWGPETAARIRAGLAVQDPELVAEIKANQEAEKKIEKLGIGVCLHCKEEVIKNERGLWESESLVEYCQDSRDHKHKPSIRYED